MNPGHVREKTDMVKAHALLIDLDKGQAAVILARSMGLIDHSLRISSTEKKICIPLLRPADESESKRLSLALGGYSTEEREFKERRPARRTLIQALQNRLPPRLLAVLPKSFDVMGHVAIVELPGELAPFEELVGKAILETCTSIRTVMAKAGVFSTDYRVRDLRLIAGDDKPVTHYREHGCVFELDVRTVFFSPRLSYERLRVASQVQPSEIVIDMFAGVGPYSILIAKRQPSSTIYAVDVNPSAFKFLVSNTLANKVLGSVRPIRGDVREVVRSDFSRMADRVIMNLPGSAIDFINEACLSLKERGGVIHFYSFESGEEPQKAASAKLQDRVHASGRRVKSILATRIVKAVAPYRLQIAVDAVIA
jgi:tRNA (guanine37-N1)-methyltransferase